MNVRVLEKCKVKGKVAYKCEVDGKAKVLSSAGVIDLVRNGANANVKIKKVYGRETIEILSEITVDRASGNANKPVTDNQLMQYVKDAASRGIKVLDLGPIRVDTTTFKIRKNETKALETMGLGLVRSYTENFSAKQLFSENNTREGEHVREILNDGYTEGIKKYKQRFG